MTEANETKTARPCGCAKGGCRCNPCTCKNCGC